ncbi:alpha/beta hydrolase [Candidatus Kaiserbacteria bacterium]|nr:alpha/beta hydrolase [Candidatus Kaiserbacteria bacterium]
MNSIKTESFKLAIYSAGDEKAEKMALVLPGRLDTKDYAHMHSLVDFLGQKGYFAISFDPPGTWESAGDISLYTVPMYLRAIDEVIEYYGNKSTVIAGHSRGGTMALCAGVTNPSITHIIAVMSHYGPSELSEEAKSAGVSISYRDIPPGTERTEEKKRFDLPLSYFDDPTEYKGLETCAKPKLFFFGTEDDLVFPEDVCETFEVSAEPKELHELNSEHDYRLHPEIMEEVNQVVESFLERN